MFYSLFFCIRTKKSTPRVSLLYIDEKTMVGGGVYIIYTLSFISKYTFHFFFCNTYWIQTQCILINNTYSVCTKHIFFRFIVVCGFTHFIIKKITYYIINCIRYYDNIIFSCNNIRTICHGIYSIL